MTGSCVANAAHSVRFRDEELPAGSLLASSDIAVSSGFMVTVAYFSLDLGVELAAHAQEQTETGTSSLSPKSCPAIPHHPLSLTLQQ